MFASLNTTRSNLSRSPTASELQNGALPSQALVSARAPSPVCSRASEDRFDEGQSRARAGSATGIFGFLTNIPGRIEEMHVRHEVLCNLNAAMPYAFPQNGRLLYDFLWQDAASEEERSSKLLHLRPRNVFNFVTLLETSLDRQYRGERVKKACRRLLKATLGEHQDHRSAVLALHRLYLRQHSDRALERTWIQKSDEDDYRCVFQALNTVKSILNTDGLKDELFAPDVPAPTFWEKTSAFFFRVKSLAGRFFSWVGRLLISAFSWHS